VGEIADQIVAAGAEIIWVLEQDSTVTPGTAELCMDTMDVLGNPQVGWCVGDDETMPVAGTFDDSPFSVARGFDMIVPRTSMVIEFTTSHGTPGGNENITGEELLAEVQRIVAEQR
jgi:hypothetical protein